MDFLLRNEYIGIHKKTLKIGQLFSVNTFLIRKLVKAKSARSLVWRDEKSPFSENEGDVGAKKSKHIRI